MPQGVELANSTPIDDEDERDLINYLDRVKGDVLDDLPVQGGESADLPSDLPDLEFAGVDYPAGAMVPKAAASPDVSLDAKHAFPISDADLAQVPSKGVWKSTNCFVIFPI